jgi:AbiV family abortive infection protein
VTPSYPHGQAKPRLTDRQRWNLAGASLDNAIALRDDAILLADADRLQRAAFVVQASLEEVLKAYLCLTRSPETDEDWDRFWKTFRDHRLKLALMKETDPDVSDEGHDEGNRMLRTFRERTLYVDVSPWGNPMTPKGLLDPGELNREGIARWVGIIQSALARELVRLEESEPPPDESETSGCSGTF